MKIYNHRRIYSTDTQKQKRQMLNHIKTLTEFVNKIKNITWEKGDLLESFDVVSFFH